MCAEKASFHIGCRGFLLMSFLVLITKRDVGCSGTRCFATSLHATTCLLLRVTNKAFYVKKKKKDTQIFVSMSCHALKMIPVECWSFTTLSRPDRSTPKLICGTFSVNSKQISS